MWKPGHAHSLGMSSPGVSRPWTPPDTEEDASPRSDYFSDSFTGPLYDGKNWRQRQQRDEPSRCDTPTDDGARSKHTSQLASLAPHTPIKTFGLQNRDAHGAPQYPYTPDSSRILSRSIELPVSPSPWGDAPSDDDDDQEGEEDEDELSISSPVQNALSSCISQFEELIHTRQPDEDQLEYIVGQFEAMATYLSAPSTQSRHGDAHLFDEQRGLGITEPDNQHEEIFASASFVNPAYVAEVGRYIAGVQKYIEDLKLRLDEVKTLNGIQLDVIADLRRQMSVVRQGMGRGLGSVADSADIVHFHDDDEDYEDVEKDEDEKGNAFGHESWETIEDLPSHPDANKSKQEAGQKGNEVERRKQPTRRIITIIHHPPHRSFWSSFAEALDNMAGLWLEY